ncbi:MAG: hypothetical protein WC637_06780 [Victivallales bacterium]|jgi:hypothetical protein
MNIDIERCFNYGIEKFKQNMTYYVVGFLAIVGIGIGIYIISLLFSFIWGFAVNMIGSKIHLNEMGINIISFGGSYIISALLWLIIIPFTVGYWKGIRKEYEGETVEITEVFSTFDIIIPCLLNCVVANLIVTAGVLLFISPIILLAVLMHLSYTTSILIISLCSIIPSVLLLPLSFLPVFFLVKDEIQGLNALKRSLKIFMKNPILILWTNILAIFAIIGLLVCCVGILATAPIAMCAMYKLFQQAIGEDNLPPVETAPPQDDENAPLPN